MSDTHATDLLALVRELSELEFRRGGLVARIEWHLRLHDVATQQAPAPAAAGLRVVPATPKRPHGAVQAAVLARVSAQPGTAREVADAVGGSREVIRQALISLVKRGQLTQAGGRYAVAESHAGSGLVHAAGA
jgi:hypothetical protein